jgi:hypothetical protein
MDLQSDARRPAGRIIDRRKQIRRSHRPLVPGSSAGCVLPAADQAQSRARHLQPGRHPGTVRATSGAPARLQIWTLISFQLWCRAFIDARPARLRGLMRVALIARPAPGRGAPGGPAAAGVTSEPGHQVTRIPIDPRFPSSLSWLRRWRRPHPAQRGPHVPSLRRLREVDVAHAFRPRSGEVPARADAASRSRVITGSGSCCTTTVARRGHLGRWGRGTFLRWVEEGVVPSEYLRTVFARHDHKARVIRTSWTRAASATATGRS